MYKSTVKFCLTIVIWAFYAGIFTAHSVSENELLLLISFDGFRYDYLDRVKAAGKETPNFDALIENGVKAKWINNAFITKTFPNHYTIVTGLYEESHGVVGNIMYDPVLNETFNKRNKSQEADPRWWNNNQPERGPEPIWITNQKGRQTIFKRRSGVMFWPGSAAENHGLKPFRVVPYDPTILNKTRIDNIVSWFSDTNEPINLGLLYFSEPDHLGHQVGPDSPRMIDMIVALDELVGYLVQELKNVQLFHKMNIIITSDHGFTQVNKYIALDKYVKSSKYTAVGASPIWNIRPNAGHTVDELYTEFKAVPNLIVYKKEELPSHFHYRNNQRIQPIVISAPEGFSLCHNDSDENDFCQKKGGNHGYDNQLQSMHPFFIAHGPIFKKEFVSEPFENVNIYPLMCHILDVAPAPNNGSLLAVHHILLDDGGHLVQSYIGLFPDTTTYITVVCVVVFAVLLTSLFCIAALTNHSRRSYEPNRCYVEPALELKKPDGLLPLLSSDTEDEIP